MYGALVAIFIVIIRFSSVFLEVGSIRPLTYNTAWFAVSEWLSSCPRARRASVSSRYAFVELHHAHAAVAAAAAAAWTSRDLKPSNILLRRRRNADPASGEWTDFDLCIADFGSDARGPIMLPPPPPPVTVSWRRSVEALRDVKRGFVRARWPGCVPCR